MSSFLSSSAWKSVMCEREQVKKYTTELSFFTVIEQEKRKMVTHERVQAGEKMHPLIFASHSIASERHPERNEDSFIADQESGLAGVFDGVGVPRKATIPASQIAARVILQEWKQFLRQKQPEGTLLTLFPQESSSDLKTTLNKLAEHANSQIRLANKGKLFQRGEPQATTMVLVAFCRQRDGSSYVMPCVSVGDSRIYLLREHQALSCLTRDDGFLTTLVHQQKISEVDALRIDQAVHPDQLSEAELSYFKKRSEIFQMLGGTRRPLMQSDQTRIIPGDRILLCSDGLHDNLTNDEIEELVKQADSTTVAQTLVEHALDRSREACSVTMRAKPDDMTAVVITCQKQHCQ
jgi:protein phosphatase